MNTKARHRFKYAGTPYCADCGGRFFDSHSHFAPDTGGRSDHEQYRFDHALDRTRDGWWDHFNLSQRAR